MVQEYIGIHSCEGIFGMPEKKKTPLVLANAYSYGIKHYRCKNCVWTQFWELQYIPNIAPISNSCGVIILVGGLLPQDRRQLLPRGFA